VNKLLITYGWGEENEQLHRITRPGKEAYARLHGYDLWCPTREKFKKVDDGRHASWFKIAAIKNAIVEHTFDDVLWLDADVGIVDPYTDILSEAVGLRPFHCVTHHTADGYVPNCGVLVVKLSRQADTVSKMLDAIWSNTVAPRADHWWEQAAFIDLYARTVHCNSGLHWKWNPHINDVTMQNQGFLLPQPLSFFHATQWPDRASELKKRCFI